MNALFTPRNLLRVNDYEFEDGGKDRDKYLLVLFANDKEAYVIHCLTTSNNRFNISPVNLGCGKFGKSVNYWAFPSGHVIGPMNYHFAENTFIFFLNNIRKTPVSNFDKQIKKGFFGIVKLDELPLDQFKLLLNCIINSGNASLEIEEELKKILCTH